MLQKYYVMPVNAKASKTELEALFVVYKVNVNDLIKNRSND